eukprot:2501188-Rhodomonas_salina.2
MPCSWPLMARLITISIRLWRLEESSSSNFLCLTSIAMQRSDCIGSVFSVGSGVCGTTLTALGKSRRRRAPCAVGKRARLVLALLARKL